MKIFFAGSERMQIPNVPIALGNLGHEVILYPKSMEYVEEHEEEYDPFRVFLKNAGVDFVISTIFFQAVAAFTHELGIPYAVYGMDSPHYAAWTPTYPKLENVYLFCFDTAELRLFRECGYSNVYYMPLAAGVTWADTIRVTAKEREQYRCDVSFVGGLYGDNLYDQYSRKLSDSTQQMIADILEQNAFRWGEEDGMLPAVTPELLEECRERAPRLCNRGFVMPDAYYFRQWTLARKLSNIERQLLLAFAAEQYDFRLYTRANEIIPPEIPKYPQVDAMTEQLKVFSESRVNLNITLRSIENGVPLRVFDIMSRAGFVLTDYRSDAQELFKEEKEIVMFKTPEEMAEKIDFYLRNEEIRKKIGRSAYEKVKNSFSYEKQLQKIIKILFPGG